MDQVRKYITRATELTALSVYRLIQEKGFSQNDVLTAEESLKREKLIDQSGVDVMSTALIDIPFSLEIVGSEGRKHIHQYGEALPALMGTFGPAPGGAGLKLDMVNDVVEGSKAAKLNSSGAVSVIAVSSHSGLMPTPSDTDYMDKLFGPPQLKGKISMHSPVEENLAEVIDVFKVDPAEINVIIMERDRNARYINACQKFGVNLILIKAGDFLPSILSFMDPEKSLNNSSSTHKKGPHLIMGSGGFEEGVMAAVAAKALGAFCEARGWSADSQINKKYSKVWSLDDLVSGKIKDCLVSVSSITGDDKWFNLEGVRVNPSASSALLATSTLRTGVGHQVTTLTVDKSGVKIEQHSHH